MVGADSYRIPRVPQYSGVYSMESVTFRLRACHPLGKYVPVLSTILQISYSTDDLQIIPNKSHYPRCTTLADLYMQPGLGFSHFARRYSGNLFDFSSWRYLDVSLPSVLLRQMADDSALPEPGCPIRISTDLRLFAPSRGFSQLVTSFIDSLYLGIHHVPLVT